MKGDMYLRDLLYTKGHSYEVTDGTFHPNKENICLTSSKDSTIRIWDLNTWPFGIEQELPCKNILKFKAKNGKKVAVDRLLVSKENNMIYEDDQ